MQKRSFIKTIIGTVFLLGVPLFAAPIQTMYFGGDIITMEGDKPEYVEAVIERDGKIIYAGKKAEAINNFAGKTVEVDLEGKTMIPGLIGPHLHPSITASMLPNDTIAARTLKYEEHLGSIEKGKVANFTILEKNPFKIDKMKIKDIPVVAVVQKGKMVINKAKLLGGDRSIHGCIGSAGYSWCEKTKQCERPWELAKKEKFENSAEAFNNFCENKL
jgi:hypothetical protein